MRKANSHNFSMHNNYMQPEHEDLFSNLQVTYRKQYDTPRLDSTLTPKTSDNKFAFLEATNYTKQQKEI